MVDSRSNIFRIISFTLAGADVLQTMPGTYTLYKKQWKARSISPVCMLYATVRYMSIISLVTNGIGFYGTDFTDESCKSFYMVPNVTAMLASMAVQGIIFIRTWAITGRSVWVLRMLGLLLFLDIPVQIFGIVYHRSPHVSDGNCKGKVLQVGEPDWNIVYYIAHVIFDWICCFIATFWLVYSSRTVHQAFNISKFVRKVLRHGLLFTLAVSIANLWVVFEFAQLLRTGVGATLPLAIVMISAQHLVLGTQRPDSDHPSTSSSTGRDRSRSLGQSGRGGRGFPTFANRSSIRHGDVELQSGVFVLTETYVQPREETKSTVDFADAQAHSDESTRKQQPVGPNVSF